MEDRSHSFDPPPSQIPFINSLTTYRKISVTPSSTLTFSMTLHPPELTSLNRNKTYVIPQYRLRTYTVKNKRVKGTYLTKRTRMSHSRQFSSLLTTRIVHTCTCTCVGRTPKVIRLVELQQRFLGSQRTSVQSYFLFDPAVSDDHHPRTVKIYLTTRARTFSDHTRFFSTPMTVSPFFPPFTDELTSSPFSLSEKTVKTSLTGVLSLSVSTLVSYGTEGVPHEVEDNDRCLPTSVTK